MARGRSAVTDFVKLLHGEFETTTPTGNFTLWFQNFELCSSEQCIFGTSLKTEVDCVSHDATQLANF